MSSPSVSLVAGRTSTWKWWVCGLLLLATMINYMDRLTLNQLSKEIIDTFQLTELHYGYLESAFGSAFALGAIVAGWLADRWNVRFMYAASVLAWSLAGLATGLASSFAALLVCRFLLGLAEAGNWPCALRTTQRILPQSERTLGNSILQSGAAIGAILTPLIVLQTMITMGKAGWTDTWRYPFIIIGIIGMGWVIFWLTSVRQEDLDIGPRAPGPSLVSILYFLIFLMALDLIAHTALAHIAWVPLTVKIVVTVAGIAGVFAWLQKTTKGDSAAARAVFFRRFAVLGVITVAINLTWHFFRAWLPLFLRTKHGYSLADVSWFSMAYYCATDAGALTAGFVTLYLARRGLAVHRSRVVVFASCAALTALSITVPQLASGALLTITLLLVGFGALGLFPNYYSFSQELTVQHQGKVSGALGCICWLSMSLLHEVVGNVVKSNINAVGGAVGVPTLLVNTGGSYTWVMSFAGVVPLIALAVLLFFWGPAAPIGTPAAGPSDAGEPGDVERQPAQRDLVRV